MVLVTLGAGGHEGLGYTSPFALTRPTFGLKMASDFLAHRKCF
jgi:hypothetical protein